jgi:hypothetical protein
MSPRTTRQANMSMFFAFGDMIQCACGQQQQVTA